MAKAFAELEASAEATTLTHPERLALLLDQEASYRRDRRLAWTRQHLVELGFQHGLQEVANSIPKASFDRVELAVEKMAARLDFQLRQAGCPDMVCHGVISALDQAGDYAAFIFQPLPLRHLSTDRYEKLKPHIRLIRRG